VLSALLIAVVYGQTKPAWPMAASTSLFVHGWERRDDHHFFRWFYDRSLGKERVDAPMEWRGEMYLTTTILNTATMREYFIIHQGSLIECYERASNMSIPHPDFARARYIGKAEIGPNVVDHWTERNHEGRDHLQIFDRTTDGYVVRMDFEDGRRPHATTFEFHEWDASSQELPMLLQSSC
jgi:hypothetical protein